MKTLGLIGGMSWESTIPYYRVINESVRERLGGLHSAPIILYSLEFAEMERLQVAGEWDRAGAWLADIAERLERAGAEMLVICTNTMHVVADTVEAAVDIPLLHIADATGEAVKAAGLSRVGLLGTRFTMEQDFYRRRLEERYGLETLVPDAGDRAEVHRVIFDELCCGRVNSESRADYLRIIEALARDGAEGIILGCTEIGILVRPGDTHLPLFDTAAIHARAAAMAALG